MTPVPVAVIGGGIMGAGIAGALALAGHRVAVAEPHPQTAEALVARLRDSLARDVPGDELASALARIRIAPLAEAVSDAGLVIEAVPETMAIKTPVWREVDAAAPPGAILASNTSALDIDELAGLVADPGRVVGIHWFNPAHVVPGVEIVRGVNSRPDVVEAARELIAAAGKRPVVVVNSPGFVANRIQFALVREALLCVEEGIASAEEVDAIVSSTFGPRLAVLGPLANADLGGLDTYLSILERLAEALGERFTPPDLLERLVAEGRLGTKTGAGIRDYPDDAARELTELRDRRLRRVLAATRSETGES